MKQHIENEMNKEFVLGENATKDEIENSDAFNGYGDPKSDTLGDAWLKVRESMDKLVALMDPKSLIVSRTENQKRKPWIDDDDRALDNSRDNEVTDKL